VKQKSTPLQTTIAFPVRNTSFGAFESIVSKVEIELSVASTMVFVETNDLYDSLLVMLLEITAFSVKHVSKTQVQPKRNDRKTI
jgi:hypothetical protein